MAKERIEMTYKGQFAVDVVDGLIKKMEEDCPTTLAKDPLRENGPWA